MAKDKAPLPDKYAIGREWSAGFVAALTPTACESDATAHWEAGYSAGYRLRWAKHEEMNKYLVSIGVDPMGIVRLA